MTREEAIVSIGLDTSSLRSKTASFGASFKESLKSIATGWASAIALGGIASGINSLMSKIDELRDKAENLGVGTDFLQGMGGVAVQDAVGGIKTFDKAIAELSSRLGEAKNGSAQAIAKFEKYGITLQNIRALNSEQMFYLIADQIKAIPDPAERTAAAFDLMGKSGRNLTGILSQGSEQLKQMAGAIAKLSEEDIKNIERGKSLIEESKNRLAVIGGKFLSDLAEGAKTLGLAFSGTGIATALEQESKAGYDAQVAASKQAAINEPERAKEKEFFESEREHMDEVAKLTKEKEEREKRFHKQKMDDLKEEEAAHKRNLDWQKSLGDAMESLDAAKQSEFMPTLQELADFGGPYGNDAARLLDIGDEVKFDRMAGNKKFVEQGLAEAESIRTRMRGVGMDLDPNKALRERFLELVNGNGLPIEARMNP